MTWPTNVAILGLLALAFLISMGVMVAIGLWQFRDRDGKKPGST